jgi:hypothetical protein
MSREIFANGSQSTLSAAITSTSATSISVAAGSFFPSSGNFRLNVETETMLCTARSGNTLTVVRGIEGSTAATHGIGQYVTQILTAGALQRWGRDNDPYFDTGRPNFGIYDASGNVLTSGDFTATNVTTTTIADQNGIIVLKSPGQGSDGSDNLVLYTRTAPTPPYSIVAAMDVFGLLSGDHIHAGVCFRESSTGKFTVLFTDCAGGEPSIRINRWNSPTSYDGDDFNDATMTTPPGHRIWFHLYDDGTNLNYFVSDDGINWVGVAAVSRTAFMSGGPDQVGFAMDLQDSMYDNYIKLVHWDGA